MSVPSNPYSARSGELDGQAQERPARSPLLIWGCSSVVVILLLAITASVAFVVGAIKGQLDLYSARAEEDAAEIRSFLTEHEGKFDRLRVEATSDGMAYVTGTVDTQADKDLLQEAMQKLFGDLRSEEIVSPVEVAPLYDEP
jgi:hypothetical protein